MPSTLSANSYGKSAVRLTKVTRHADRHDLVELNVAIQLRGDFSRSYTHGDNTTIVATDSMRNTVYVLAKSHPVDSPEAFALHLADHLVKVYKQVEQADVEIEQSSWRRIIAGGTPHPTAFESGGAELRLATAKVIRAGKVREVTGGLKDLLVLKTTDSAFVGYVRDEFTTLPETTDRIFATKVSSTWQYKSPKADFNATFAAIRAAMLDVFADHKSDAVQQTMFDMGEAALKIGKSIASISLRMPNKHRIPFNLKPFGMEFQNDIFVTTDEPYGDISATLTRK